MAEKYYQTSFDTRNESLRRFEHFKNLSEAIKSFVRIYGHQPIHIITVNAYTWDLGPLPKESEG